VLNTLRSKILLVSGITFAVLPGIILLVLVQFNRVQTEVGCKVIFDASAK